MNENRVISQPKSVFLPIWQHEFEIDLFGVSAIYYFYFAGSMVNVLLAPIILKYCHSRVMMIIAAIGSRNGVF